MFSVVLLDDESLIVDSLKHLLPWNELECEIVGDAQNGTDGLALIERLSPDLVISDIVMPGISGLEIAGYCAEHGIEIVIISAYNDFSYAQEAMKLGVRSYVLKPISKRELLEAVQHGIQTIRDRRKAEREEAWAQQTGTLATSSLLFRVACYDCALSEEEKNMLRQMNRFHFGMVAGICFYNLEDSAGYQELANRMRTQIASALPDEQLIWGNASDSLTFICSSSRSKDTPGEFRQGVTDRLLHLLRRFSEDTGCIAIGSLSDIFADFSALHEAFLQCMNRLQYGFFEDHPQLYTEDRTQSVSDSEYDTKLLLHHLRHGNEQEWNVAFQGWRESLAAAQNRSEAVYEIRRLYRDATIAASSIGMSQKPSANLNSKRQNENFSSMASSLKQYMLEICRYSLQTMNTMGRIKAIIENQYSDVNLNLNTVSERLQMNPAYVSRMFKKEYGDNFSNYLSNIRMEKACFFLTTTNSKIKDIASQVGYDDEHYFSLVFRKQTGMTPSQYRTEHRKG